MKSNNSRFIYKKTKCINTFLMIQISDSKLHLIWSQCCYSSDTSVAAKAVQLLVHLTKLTQGVTGPGNPQQVIPGLPDLCQEAALAVESLIVTLCYAPQVDEMQLKTVLSSAVQLSRVSSQSNAVLTVECLTRLLMQAQDSTLVLLCESLAAIGDTQPEIVAAAALVDIMSLLKRLTGRDSKETQAILLLCGIMFQTHASHAWSLQAIQVVQQAALRVELWVAYKIARSAAR